MQYEIRGYRASGKVQGVGFRAATRDKAEQLDLAGWVRNLPDGRVAICAAGSANALATFETWLQQGPPSARVDRLERADTAAETEPTHPFAIR